MKPFYDDQRISGYLDGELTAAEQASFEEELAQNAELRQVVEELRSLRSDLDLLPRARLEADFAARVLRRAEREMLSGGKQPLSPAPTQPAHDLTPASALDDASPRHWSRQRWARPLLWSAATIAAAVMIMAFERNQDVKHNQLAQLTRPEAAHGPLPAGELSAPADQVAQDGALQQGGPRAKSSPLLKSLADDDRSTAKAPAADNVRADRPADPSAAVPEKPAAPAADALANSENRTSGDSNHMMFRRQTAQAAGSSRDGQERRANSTRPAPHALATDDKNKDAGSAPSQVPLPAASAEPRAVTGLAESETKKSSSEAGKAESRVAARSARERFGLGANRNNATEPVVVAQCTATPDVASDQFKTLLRQRGIPWQAGASAEDLADAKQLSLANGQKRIEEQKADAAKATEKFADASGGARKGSAGSGEDGLPAADKRESLRHADDVSVFYVEASPEQIHALIDDLKSQPAVYQKLTVSAAMDSWQYRGLLRDRAGDADAPNLKVAAGEERSEGGLLQRSANSAKPADEPATPKPATPPSDEENKADKLATTKQDETPSDSANRAVVAPQPAIAGVSGGRGGLGAAPGARSPKGHAQLVEPGTNAATRIVANQQKNGSPGSGGGFSPPPENAPAAPESFGAAKMPSEQARAGDKQALPGSLASKPAKPSAENSDKPAAGASATPTPRLESDQDKESAANESVAAKSPPARIQAVFVFRLAAPPAAALAAPASPAAPATPPASAPASPKP